MYKLFLKNFTQIFVFSLFLSTMVFATYAFADKYTWNTSSGAGSTNGSWQKVVLSSSGIGFAFNYNSNTLYKTTDSGASFNSVTSFGEKIRSIAVSETGTYVIVSTNDSNVSNDGYVYVSSSQGTSFTQLSSSLGVADWEGVAVSESGQYMYAISSTSGYFSYSTDYGLNWTFNAASVAGTKIVKVSNDGSKVFFGGDGASSIYYMLDNSGSISGSIGVPESSLTDFDISANGLRLVFVPQFGKPWIYDWGSAWSTVNNLPDTGNHYWKATAISGDGNTFAFLRSFQNNSSTNDGALYVTNNGGTSYGVEYLLNQSFPSNSWTSLVMSSDAYYISLTSSAGYIFTGQLDTTSPNITNFLNATNTLYGVGSTIEFRVGVDEPVYSSGLNITFETGATDRTCSVTFVDGSNMSSYCQYVVQAGDTSADLSINAISGTLTNENGFSRSDFSSWYNLFSSTFNIIVDGVAPSVSLASLSGGQYASGTIALSATASDNISSIAGVQFRYSIFGTSVNIGSEDTTSPYSTSFNTTLIADGTYAIHAVARDTAGNFATSTINNVIIDNTAPIAPGAPDLISAADTGSLSTDNVTASTSPTFTVSCQSGNTVRLQNGGTVLGSAACSSSSATITSSALSAGVYSLVATQIDAAGNVSAQSSALSVTIDTTSPTVSLTSPTNGSTASGTIPLEATASDSVSLVGVQFKYLDGATVSDIGLEDTSSLYSVDFDTTSITGGTYTLYAVARDTAGNVSTSSVSVVVDNTVPVSPSATSSAQTAGPTSGGGLVPVTSLPQGLLSRSQQNLSQSGGTSTTFVPTITQEVVRAMITSAGIPESFVFRRNANIQTVSNEVQNLQRVLNTLGFTVSQTGNGSVGNETRVFGNRTRSALIRFQRAFALPTTGFFGPLTRATINSILNTISR